jgi:hypothetical protein
MQCRVEHARSSQKSKTQTGPCCPRNVPPVWSAPVCKVFAATSAKSSPFPWMASQERCADSFLTHTGSPPAAIANISPLPLPLLLRRAGHPVRCVTGFASDETNSRGITFRALHFHAWIEVINNQGEWQQFDPSPESLMQKILAGGPPSYAESASRGTARFEGSCDDVPFAASASAETSHPDAVGDPPWWLSDRGRVPPPQSVLTWRIQGA